ncbi:MAG: thrombospondin type 3 repeat-containing protein [Myxococcota bacterium]
MKRISIIVWALLSVSLIAVAGCAANAPELSFTSPASGAKLGSTTVPVTIKVTQQGNKLDTGTFVVKQQKTGVAEADVTGYFSASCDSTPANCTYNGTIGLTSGQYTLAATICNNKNLCNTAKLSFEIFLDRDSDGVADDVDNCPDVPNPDQKDTDGNKVGDACSDDLDGDSIKNTQDNCPTVANNDQADMDKDGKGDACDDDADGDGISDNADNCLLAYNQDQKDSNGDGVGDACAREIDSDGDGVPNYYELTLGLDPNNPDTDGDGVSDVEELKFGTNPLMADSNGNGICDCEELGGTLETLTGVVLMAGKSKCTTPSSCADINENNYCDAAEGGEGEDSMKYPAYLTSLIFDANGTINTVSTLPGTCTLKYSGKTEHGYIKSAYYKYTDRSFLPNEYHDKANYSGINLAPIKTHFDELVGSLTDLDVSCGKNLSYPWPCSGYVTYNLSIEKYKLFYADGDNDIEWQTKESPSMYDSFVLDKDGKGTLYQFSGFSEHLLNFRFEQLDCTCSGACCETSGCDALNKTIGEWNTIGKNGNAGLVVGYINDDGWFNPQPYYSYNDDITLSFPTHLTYPNNYGTIIYQNQLNTSPIRINPTCEKKYVFSGDAIGQIKITTPSSVEESVNKGNSTAETLDFLQDRTHFSITPLPNEKCDGNTGMNVKWDYQSPKGCSYGKGRNNTLTISGLPEKNSDFGEKTLWYDMLGIVRDIVLDHAVVKVFFPKYGMNHPTKAGEQPDTPNWYYYWTQETPRPATVLKREWSSEYSGPNGSAAWWQVFSVNFTPTTITVYEGASASYLYATSVMAHENKHEKDFREEIWKGQGYNSSKDQDQDLLNDEWEIAFISCHPNCQGSMGISDFEYSRNTYFEPRGYDIQNNYPDESKQKDWAFPGKNY